MKHVLSESCILALLSFLAIGCQGPTGPQGNANVHASTVAVSSSDWIYTSGQDEYGEYHVTFTDNEITQDIVDHGMVLVYISNGSGGWQLMPIVGYTQGTSNGLTYDLEYKYSPVYGAFSVTVWYYILTDPYFWVPVNPGAQTFKIVAVAGLSKASNPNLNWNNYDDVKRALKIQD